MGEALRTIEKAMIIRLVYPTTQTNQPYLPDIKKSPKLQVLDTGLLNHFAGIQTQIFGTHDLNNLYQGRISEHIVGQELLGNQEDLLHPLRFWVREKKESTAEVDYLFPFAGRMIPIEVKSGATGSLRSLHQYMDAADETIAIRLYAEETRIDNIKTPSGKKFQLHSLPYYLAGNLHEYLTAVISC
jgi:predicted AAA+ superfamily ATPase